MWTYERGSDRREKTFLEEWLHGLYFKTRGRIEKSIHFNQEAGRRETTSETTAQILKQDLKKHEADWIQLAQHRVQRWFLV
jgi:hypothetical protein